MQVESTPLQGLAIIIPQVFEDPRGLFFESYNEVKFKAAGLACHRWVQDNFARSVKNTLRGLHFQHPPGQAKLVSCVRGRVWDVAVDIRPESPTLGQWFGVELSEENHKMLLIPVGFAHGYCVLSDVAVCLYKCNNVYDPKLEDGIRWDESEFAIPWPVSEPLLSERDKNAPTFQEYLAKLKSP